jgi:hypothetical protein
MQTWVRASEVLVSPETDIDQMIEAHAAVIVGLKRLIESSCSFHPGRAVWGSNVNGAVWLDPFDAGHSGGYR